ncbi:MAG: VRR-NUC domain-containing protein [Planctomycetota bacterium]|jgi:hypothetical protein
MPYTDKVHGETTEHKEQVEIFRWARDMESYVPELALLHAVPNGAKLPWRRNRAGKRYSPEAMRLIKEGLKAGVPDICLPVPRDGYHGFYIELKVGSNKPTDKQKQWLVALAEQGYRVDVQYGAEAAKRAICDYLGVESFL